MYFSHTQGFILFSEENQLKDIYYRQSKGIMKVTLHLQSLMVAQTVVSAFSSLIIAFSLLTKLRWSDV